MTIRVDKSIQDRFDDLAQMSNRSRNELINLALEYALKNVKFMEDKYTMTSRSNKEMDDANSELGQDKANFQLWL